MEEVWILKEFEKVAQLMPRRALSLIKQDKELFMEIIISAYLDGLISLGKAAEVLGVTREEVVEEFKRRGIPIRTPDRDDIASEVEAIGCL
ncbi:hypothetical protein A3L09_01950 [Thermococcus profundus]|uniref:Uncharacterized protein n=1 Tax=Thermococcus profundus TaxID=49899 RepID=A0A2Z2M7D8_THEPR|nr:UPF0175 family protein [Thermococcus profundus]ASJ02117.1 hypothetical protein A3L09_01950 [Thermococcus profundus]